MSTKFFTNQNEKSLYNKFTSIIEQMKDLYAFHALVGYFRSSGYFEIQEHLRRIPKVKILVGINVDSMFAEAHRKGMMFFGDEEKTKEEFLKWLLEDIKDAKYSKKVEDGIIQFTKDLIDGKIEMRAHKTKKLHAKIYLFLPEQHQESTDGWVITGSSNITNAGLGKHEAPNYEFNVALKDYDDVKFASDEFNHLWEESVPILPADVQSLKSRSHIGQQFTPFELYIKFLIEYFGNNIDYDPDTVGDLPNNFKKLSYQIDAVNQGFQMLMEHNGFFLSDVVGLGKTVVATIIAKRFIIANGSMNTKVLVVYPPALERNWKSTFRQFGLDRHTKFITNGSLSKILKEDINYWPKEEYDLILVDEAHKFRNHKSQMFGNLQRICKAKRSGEGLVSGQRKKVVLISATPLNNKPEDLYYQLQLFQDARKSTLPVTNLQSFFGPIMREYKEIINSRNPDMTQIRDLYKVIRERVIEPITVRRTRKDIDSYPAYKKDLEEQGILFPEIAPPRAQQYELTDGLSELFQRTMDYLIMPDQIQYLRYQAIAYLKPEIREEIYEQAERVSNSLAGIMTILMVKRLESSFHAFKMSLHRFMTATERMIQMFEKGRIYIAPDLRINDLMDKDWSDEDIEDAINAMAEENPRNQIFAPEDFEEGFLDDLKRDLELIRELHQSWSEIDEDPKLDAFIDLMNFELFNDEKNPTGKLVVFTESKETSDYLKISLNNAGFKKILEVSSKNRKRIFTTIQENFDANYTGTPKDDYNIVITTDVLAEGVNLHRSNVIVNYDTPWNATRLMQRIGRVNRIGSIAGTIFNYNFYPSRQGDSLIRLYNKALVKLQSFHSAFGEDTQIYTHEELVEQFKLYETGIKDDEDKRLHYLRFIREFKDTNPNEFKRIKKLPLKARTGRKNNEHNPETSSVVFLKSPIKMEFYQVDESSRIHSLTFLEAAEKFEAKSAESSRKLPEFHYVQVQAALNDFEKNFFSSENEGVTTTEKSDALSAQGKKFLRDLKSISKKKEVKEACTALHALVDKGTFSQLPNELRKIRLQAQKRKITHAQALNQVMALAKKYEAGEESDVESSLRDMELNIDPDIVIAESFD